jgi:hypothetical protein
MAFIFTEYVRCIVISSKIFYNRNMKIISDESEKKKIMVRMNFCDGWRCYQTGNKEATFDVTLPHDAMLLDSRSECSPGGENTGWYDAMDYTYEKTFFVPAKMQGQKVYLEFEGVYHKASVYVNDKKIAYQHNGYIGFYVDLTDHLCYDAENVIRWKPSTAISRTAVGIPGQESIDQSGCMYCRGSIFCRTESG